MSAIDLCGVLGLLLAIAAALDFSVKEQVKNAISAWVVRAAARNSGFGYAGTSFLDRIFGKKLFSVRAMSIYVVLSLVSIALSYLFAVMSTADEGQSMIAVFPRGFTWFDGGIFLLFICFAALGDIASYAQTRLFVRAVDQHKHVVVSAGLIVADIVTSLSLFFFSFSIAKTIAYMLVIQLTPTGDLTTRTTYAAPALGAALPPPPAKWDTSTPNFQYAFSIAQAKSQKDLSDLANVTKTNELSTLKNKKLAKFVSYNAKLGHLDYSIAPLDYYSAWNSTNQLLDAIAKEVANNDQEKHAALEKQKHFMLDMAAGTVAGPEGEKKQLSTLTVERRMSPSDVVALAGPTNSFVAAMERTMFDFYVVIGFKLSPYISFDPYDSLWMYVNTLRAESGVTLFGAGTPDPDRAKLFAIFPNQQYEEKRALHVPFSPMVASSLASSIFFFVYLLAVGLASVRKVVVGMAGRMAPSFDWDRAIFTTMALAISIVTGGTFLLDYIATGLWRLLFS
ncbi:hypothetical protein [Paraburkholderia dipogonis]|uniref:hypothetical protein n=1 Tax=Paraburkholderia dipogonis TaxID=1211383 RepID=UPI0038B933DE